MEIKLKAGARLALERKARKLTQAAMAELLLISPSAYSRLERNETYIEITQLIHFATVLGIPTYEFVPETLTPPDPSEGVHKKQTGLPTGLRENYPDKNAFERDLYILQQDCVVLKEKVKQMEAKITEMKRLVGLIGK